MALASLIGFVLGLFVAYYYAGFMGGILLSWFDWSPTNSKWVAFITTFLIIVIIVNIIGKLLTKIADFAFLGLLNKFLGGVFSVIKYTVLLSVVFMFLEQSPFNGYMVSEEKKEGSLLYGPIASIVPNILPGLWETFDNIREDEGPIEDRVPMETEGI